MLIGVLSDSHDHVPNVRRAVALFQERGVDLVIHGGDFVAPFAVAPLADLECPVVAVYGNNDGERIGLQRRFDDGIGEVHAVLGETELDGRKIAVMHYPEMADAIADAGRYDLIVYGHSHQIEIRPVAGGLVLNPGEVGGWLTGRATAALVETADLGVEIVDLDA